MNVTLREGRFITESDDEQRRNVMVIGVNAEDALFPGKTNGIVGTEGGQVQRVLDIEPVEAVTIEEPALPLPTQRPTPTKTKRSTSRRTTRTIRTARTIRTKRSTRTSKIRSLC